MFLFEIIHTYQIFYYINYVLQKSYNYYLFFILKIMSLNFLIQLIQHYKSLYLSYFFVGKYDYCKIKSLIIEIPFENQHSLFSLSILIYFIVFNISNSYFLKHFGFF